MGPTWGPSGTDRTQVGPMVAPWTMLSGLLEDVVGSIYMRSVLKWITVTWQGWEDTRIMFQKWLLVDIKIKMNGNPVSWKIRLTFPVLGYSKPQRHMNKSVWSWDGRLALRYLTHWGRTTHICISKLTIIGSDNGLSPGWRQAIIWTNAGILLIGTIGTDFSEIPSEIHTFSFKKIRLKTSSAKWRPFCLGLIELNVLRDTGCG